MIPGARLILLGRQGAGKGTQCVRLSRHFVVPHVSTGDMLRAAVREGTELGLMAKLVMDEGGLVGDEIMVVVTEIDRQGRIWFTNPVNPGNWDADSKKEIEDHSVLRADPQPDGTYKTTRVTFDTTQPNGILISQDQKMLYVAESSFTRGIARELRAYPIKDDGSLGTFTTLFTWGEDAHGIHRGIDGMCLDRDGNIVSIETTARRFAVAYPEGPAIGHTNHYLVPELRDTEYLRASSIGGSAPAAIDRDSGIGGAAFGSPATDLGSISALKSDSYHREYTREYDESGRRGWLWRRGLCRYSAPRCGSATG